MRTLIFAGLPKTGSTTLQRSYLSKVAGVHYAGKPWSSNDMLNCITNINQHGMDQFDLAANKLLAGSALSHVHVPDVVIADEVFTSTSGTDRRHIAQRLESIFEPAHVFLTLRNQLSTLKSMYSRDVLKSAGTYRSFDDWVAELKAGRKNRGLNDLLYDELVESYESTFGPDRVTVLLYEDLSSDPVRYFSQIAATLGWSRDEAVELGRNTGRLNPSRTARREIWLRFRRWFFPNVALGDRFSLLSGLGRGWINSGPRFTADFQESDKEWLRIFYAPGNCRLSSKKGLHLESYGYPMPGTTADEYEKISGDIAKEH